MDDVQDVKPTNIVSQDSQIAQPNTVTEQDSGSVSGSSNDNRKVSREDIELVQNLIERCLQLYMNQDEVVKTLLTRARIDPAFTTLVWQKLEEENADFFRAYYIRLKLKKQIILFNHLLEHQYHVMKNPVPPNVPLAPMTNRAHPMPLNNLPMGYPVAQQLPNPVTGQSNVDAMGYTHIVDGFPAPGNFLPLQINSGNDKRCRMKIETSTADVSPVMPPNTAMSSVSDMPVSPTSAASSGHFPFSASEISGIRVDTPTLDVDFTSDNGAGSSRDPLLDQIPWNFSLTDLTADLSNLGDLGALGNYPGSPFLPSNSDILLDSPEQEDIVDEFFVDSDSVPGQCPPSDEEKS